MKALITDIAGYVYVANAANCTLDADQITVNAPVIYTKVKGGHASVGATTGSVTLDQYQIEDVRYVS